MGMLITPLLRIDPLDFSRILKKLIKFLERECFDFGPLSSVLIRITFGRTSQVRKLNKEIVRYNAQHTRQSIVLDICRPNLPNERS